MSQKNLMSESDLAALAKAYRLATGKDRTEVANELAIARPTLIQAEENPERSLTKLRVRIIEAYSPYKVSGPYFRLDPK